jgi:hypothetical protein
MRNRSRFWMMTLLISFSSPAFSAPSSSPCSSPDLSSLIRGYASQAAVKKQYFPDTEYVVQNATLTATLITQKPSVQWLGIAWEGPVSGMLFALACDGKIIDAVVVGSIEEIRKGPELPEVGDTVLVNATDGTGTDGVHKTISLFAIKDGRLTSIWRHTSYEHAYFPGSDGDEVEFQVSLPDDRTIDVTGERRLYRWQGKDWSKTPYKIQKIHETYCWDKAQSAYGVCIP